MGNREQMYAGRLRDLVAFSRAPKSDESGKLFLAPGCGSLFDISRVDFCRRRVYLSRRWIWIPKRDDWLIWKSSGKFRTFPCASLKQQLFTSRFSVSASLCLHATILQLVHNILRLSMKTDADDFLSLWLFEATATGILHLCTIY